MANQPSHPSSCFKWTSELHKVYEDVVGSAPTEDGRSWGQLAFQISNLAMDRKIPCKNLSARALLNYYMSMKYEAREPEELHEDCENQKLLEGSLGKSDQEGQEMIAYPMGPPPPKMRTPLPSSSRQKRKLSVESGIANMGSSSSGRNPHTVSGLDFQKYSTDVTQSVGSSRNPILCTSPTNSPILSDSHHHLSPPDYMELPRLQQQPALRLQTAFSDLPPIFEANRHRRPAPPPPPPPVSSPTSPLFSGPTRQPPPERRDILLQRMEAANRARFALAQREAEDSRGRAATAQRADFRAVWQSSDDIEGWKWKGREGDPMADQPPPPGTEKTRADEHDGEKRKGRGKELGTGTISPKTRQQDSLIVVSMDFSEDRRGENLIGEKGDSDGRCGGIDLNVKKMRVPGRRGGE